jgi:eukaryotic-like serine/threonine-protein kinase
LKKSPLPSGLEKRAAALAVQRFGADKTRVEGAVRHVLQAQAQGQNADLLGALVAQKLLTPSQAEILRLEIATPTSDSNTQLPAEGVSPIAGNGNTPIPNGERGLPSTPSGTYLRTLGEYRLLRRLGQGGMGSVYLGYEEGQKRQVAIKVLSDQLSSNRAYVERFYREAKSGALLDHPNIVRCITAGQDPESGKHYLVLEFVDGPSAHALLDRKGHLSVGDAVHLVLDIARGLEHAHSRNVVHRDIKPDNILITQSGIAKLGDLGLAKRLDEVSNLTGVQVGFGTLDYIPYEQAVNAKQADVRSDIYALGGTLYHLLTGQVPFPSTNYLEIAEKKLRGEYVPASAVNSDVPPALDRILAKMLASQPLDRYQVVSELIVDLERANLAAPVPSFADAERVLQDPLMRERLTTPTQPTQLDLQAPVKNEPEANGKPDTWFLRYRNRDGQWCKSKMTTRDILARLAEGKLSGNVEASRHSRGEFQALMSYPEFHQELVSVNRSRSAGRSSAPSKQVERRAPAPEIPESATSDKGLTRRGVLVAGAALGLFLVFSALIYIFLISP